MSITDELRKYATVGWEPWAAAREQLYRMCDRIDAEHERLMAERRRSCVFYDAERNYCKVHDEGDMAELGYVRLPVDADGVPIRIGDVMEWPNGETFEVIGIGEGVLFYTKSECDGPAEWTGASTKRHYHTPTVEDVLRDVVTLCHNTWKEGSAFEFYDVDDVMKSGNIAKFVAKLRLAESEDA